MSVLVVGFGNPAREDDGIGPSIAERVEALGLEDVTVDIDYQLSVDHGKDASDHDVVVFVDASASGAEPFTFERVAPERQVSFSSHSVSPEGVLGLAEELFGARPHGYVLGVRGYSFEMFRGVMTERALDNLEEAFEYLRRTLETGRYCERKGDE